MTIQSGAPFQAMAAMFIDPKDRCVHNTAKAFDWVAALTLLVLGILGACAIFAPLGIKGSYFCLGAGIIYTAFMFFHAFYVNCTGHEASARRFFSV